VSEAAVSNQDAGSLRDPALLRPNNDAVRRWLLAIWALIMAMVVLGGITRLTGSGLSIVEWQPVAGAWPPLGEHDWQVLFDKYRASPQFREVNAWMALGDFKRIFFWEYLHRLVGRLVGVAVLLPWLYFLWRRALPRPLALKTLGLFGLGGLQGLLGWYMVQSGLWDEPRVSHFRLAAHLLLAFVTGQLVLWLALDQSVPRRSSGHARPAYLAALWAFIALLALQVVYGAFMAGTHAGYYFATFPDMHGEYLPGRFFSGDSPWRSALQSPIAIHYLHRLFGFALLSLAIGIFVFLRDARDGVRGAAGLALALTFLQFNLGAFTVVRRMELPWAAAHQACAYLVFSSAVLLLHRALRSRVA
jgi:cytochrome c oxidase assembly protein subunit 15